MFSNYNDSLQLAPNIYLANKNIGNLILKLFLTAMKFSGSLVTRIDRKLTLFELLLDHYLQIECNPKLQKKNFQEFKLELRNLSFEFFEKDYKEEKWY